MYLYVHLSVVFLIMNHQCMVMNHLKLAVHILLLKILVQLHALPLYKRMHLATL